GVDGWSRSTPLGSVITPRTPHAICHLPSYLIPSHDLSVDPSVRLYTTAIRVNTPSSPFACTALKSHSIGGGGAILVNLGIIPLALARVAPTLPSSPRNLTKIK
ncbi:hypothetical protein LY76DRAFT_526100, partial [Colletotrichum caudatum]